MKKIILSLLLIIGGYFIANAQNMNMGSTYKTAIGVKFYPGAFSIKSFIQGNNALEGLAYLSPDQFRLTGLYEIHANIEGVEGLKWYVGPGAHIGFWNSSWVKEFPDRNSGVAIGVDGVLGLDYKTKGAPLDFSLDWQPSFTFVGYNYFEGGWGGLGIRYTF